MSTYTTITLGLIHVAKGTRRAGIRLPTHPTPLTLPFFLSFNPPLNALQAKKRVKNVERADFLDSKSFEFWEKGTPDLSIRLNIVVTVVILTYSFIFFCGYIIE